MHKIIKNLGLLIVLLCGSSVAFAQFSASIEGTVSDPTGAVVPNATVVLTGMTTGVSTPTKTNASGFYKFPSLGSGSYRIKVSYPGFADEIVKDITLVAEQTRGVPFTLRPKSETTTVAVTATQVAVDTDEAKIGSVIGQKLVEELPLQGRDAFNVANQSPGVTGTGLMGTPAQNQDIFQDTTTPAVVANGAPNHSNTYLLDGISLDDSPSGGDSKLVPDPDALQEVVISTNDYSAQFGKAASIVMQMTTRAGSNDWHGNLFEDYQSNSLTARTMYQNYPVAAYGGGYIAPFTRNEFGGSLGGPIFKNKTFFFLTYDQVISQTTSAGQTQFEDPAFTAWEQTNYPGTLSAQLMKNYPVSNASPTLNFVDTVAQVQMIQGVYPSPDQDCRNTPSSGLNPQQVGPLNMPCGMNLFDNANTTTVFPHNGYQYHGRVDHNFTNQKDRVYADMFAGKLTGAGDTNPRAAFQTLGVQTQWYGAANYTHIFGPSLVNETGLGFSRIGFNVPCNQCDLLFTGINGIQNFGNGGSPVGFSQNDFHFRDMVSIVRGRHAMKTGFEWFHNQDQAPFTPNDNRNQGWGFDSPWDFASGAVDEYGTVLFNPITGGAANGAHYFRDSTYGAYIQDDWKARKDLSINVGLRWDALSNPTEAHGNLNPLIVPTSGTLLEQVAGIAVDASSGIHHPYIDLKKTYFAPRLGFAWQPFGIAHWSVRGGAGIFFDRGGNTNWSDSEAGNPPGIAGIGTSVHNSGPQPPSSFTLCTSKTFPYGCPIPAGILASVATPNGRGGFGPWLNIGGVDPHLKMAYMENFFLGVQRSFKSNWIAEADVIHANSIHEYTNTNMNRQDGEDSITWNGNGYGGFNAPNLSHSVFPNLYFNNINYTTNRAGSGYNGLTAFVRRAYAGGYSFQVAYTYQKTIDLVSTVPGAQKGEEYALVVDAYNYREQRATSSQNVPQQVSANGVWEIKTPFLHEGLVKNLVGGWQLGGLSTWLQGFPGSIYTDRRQDDFNLDGNLYDFPDKAIAGTKLKGFSQQQFLKGIFNQNATYNANGPSWPFTNFPLPVDQNGIPTGVEGNGGRNTLRGPGFVQVDGNLTKNTTVPWFFGEKGKLQFKADFYNLFNHKNLQGLDLDLGHGAIDQNGVISGNFGKTTGQGQARTIQLGAQLRF
jgi:hypothetical protein